MDTAGWTQCAASACRAPLGSMSRRRAEARSRPSVPTAARVERGTTCTKPAARPRMRFASPAREARWAISCSPTAVTRRTRFFSRVRFVLSGSMRPRPATQRRMLSAQRALRAIRILTLCRTQRAWLSQNIPRLTQRCSVAARRTPCANLAVLKTHQACTKQLCAQPAPTRSTPTARRDPALPASGARHVTSSRTATA